MESDHISQISLYTDAVAADRYRVTVIKFLPSGQTKARVLDSPYGVPSTFTPQELLDRVSVMCAASAGGESVYFTPLSEDKHHILINAVRMRELRFLISDGFKPAALLSVGPSAYQAIISVPKLGVRGDRCIGNRLAEHLNRRYGDPRLSGGVHPHCAPGFADFKPDNLNPDGSPRQVLLVRSARRVCERTLELSRRVSRACPR